MKKITKKEAIKLLMDQNIMMTEKEARHTFSVFGLSYIK